MKWSDFQYKMVIDGEPTDSSTGETYDVINPANGEIITKAPLGSREDVERAAEAAKRAQPEWSSKTPVERSKALLAIADAVRKNTDVLAELETINHGSPIRKTKNFDIPMVAEVFEYYAAVARTYLSGEEIPLSADYVDTLVKEPWGVAGLIVPWNFPLLMASWKMAPALAAGNTVVVKPASVTPMTTILFAQLIDKILPKGVLNVVTGPGSTVGEEMVVNKNIDMVSVTGSTETGRRILELASKSVKKVVAELGGKNPMIVLEDADVDAAVEGAIFGSFFNSGQVCATSSRIYVHESIHDKFMSEFIEAASKLVVGDPMKLETDLGPVAYFDHRKRVEGYIDLGIKEGAKLVLGGPVKEGPLSKGAYVPPTIFDDVAQDMRIVQEEIFGPVDVVLSFKNQEEALEYANDTIYGLSASVWTNDVKRAYDMARRLNVGTVWINEHILVWPETPWGGVKQSGMGSKELSPHALDSYLRLKWIHHDISGLVKKPVYSLFNPH